MAAVRAVAAGGPASLARFRGALVAAVLGDCVGGEFEGAEEVPMERVLQHLNSLGDESKGAGEWKCGVMAAGGDAAMVLQVPGQNLRRPPWKETVVQNPRNTAQQRLTVVYKCSRSLLGQRTLPLDLIATTYVQAEQ